MAKVKIPKSAAQMKAEMAVSRARNVLPQAEREANQAKFLEGSKIKDRLYHITPENFSEFKPGGEDPTRSGPAIWLTPNTEHMPAAHNISYRDEQGRTYPISGANAKYREGTNVMPVHVQAKNPLVLDDPTMIDWAQTVFAGGSREFPELMPPKWVEEVRKEGYDSIILADPRKSGQSHEVIMFDPAKIKSAIGNEGTYDTSNPDITKAHGGVVKMAGGGLKPVKAPKVSVPKVESPTVMKRSEVSDLFRQVGAREGTYGAQRVERAADEIPNLEKMYTRDALLDAFSGDNARALMTMNPADFEKYATPIDPFFLTSKAYSPSEGVGKMGHDEYIKYLAESQGKGGFNDVPYLIINKEEQGLPLTPFITGHEGRHRNRAMAQSGVTSGLVKLLPRAELREPFPRRFQQDYIEALKKEMEMTGNKVLPQTWTQSNPNSFDDTVIRRPAIDLPDLYANGGAVKMAEGGTPDREFIDQMKEGFSVYNKPTYGNEIPGTPTIDQQRYELTMKGQQEAENRARTTKDNLTAMDPAGTLGIADVLKTVGKSIVAPIAYVGGNAFDWLQTGKVDPAKSKARGEALEEWMRPKTQEGGEFLEDISKVGPAITGSEMSFGMHPNLWVSGIGLTTPKQTAAGLRLGKERITPFAKDVGTMATELYESGRMPGMVAPNLYAVSPEGKPTKALAPANEMGFYSPVEATALNLQRKSGSGQAFLNDIMKGENVRPDEIKTMGLDTFLKDKKNVTADEVRDYIAQNKIQLGETVYGGQIKEDPVGIAKRLEIMDKYEPEIKELYQELFTQIPQKRQTEIQNRLNELQLKRDAEADAAYTIPENKDAKFGRYQLPGGENYREIVLTLPSNPDTSKFSITKSGTNAWYLRDEQGNVLDAFNNEADANRAMKYRAGKDSTYQSSHWDEPNALAHLRVSDRVTDGKKTLLVDEVQSDWHQAGREKGYKEKETYVAKKAFQDYAGELENRYVEGLRDKFAPAITDPQQLDDYVKQVVRVSSLKDMAKFFGEEGKYNDLYYDYNLESGKNKYGVPDAPYKEDWYQLALRRAIKEAIDNGYDRIALPTGQRVAERFDLSHQIDRLDYSKDADGTYSLSGIKGGEEVVSKQGLSEKELADNVGKEVAEKMIKGEGKDPSPEDLEMAEELGFGAFKSLSGLDLSVGGKGMRKYYDEVYPNYLKKFGKKYGATVGETNLSTMTDKIDTSGYGGALYKKGEITLEKYFQMNPQIAKKYTEKVRYMDITPKMREEFKTGIHMKGGGKVSFANSIDSMRYELSKG